MVDHNCGVSVGPTLDSVYELMTSLQNRGRDAAGVFGVTQDGRVHAVKWVGGVDLTR